LLFETTRTKFVVWPTYHCAQHQPVVQSQTMLYECSGVETGCDHESCEECDGEFDAQDQRLFGFRIDVVGGWKGLPFIGGGICHSLWGSNLAHNGGGGGASWEIFCLRYTFFRRYTGIPEPRWPGIVSTTLMVE
jgi:hypothetical protein